jgi:hypothetical protein
MSDDPPVSRTIRAKQQRAKVRKFKPFAVEVGWIAYEWNSLHEAFCQVFADLLGLREHDRARAYAIWHSTSNDRAQREMLSSLIKELKKPFYHKTPPPKPHTIKLYEGVLWVLNEKMRELAGRRNTAIHAPLILVSLGREGLIFEVETNTFTGNPRACELPADDNEIRDEYEWYRDHLEKLSAYVMNLHWAWQTFDGPKPIAWPDKPPLLPRGQYRNRAASRRKNGSK